VNRFAIELKDDGKGHAVDAAEACASCAIPAKFVWIHLDGREQETLGWLKEHAGIPSTVIYALTATETRPRSDAIEDGALINLRGPAEGDIEGDKLVSIRAWVEHGRAITVTFRHLGGLDDLKGQMERGEIKDPGDLIASRDDDHQAAGSDHHRSGRRGRQLRNRDRARSCLRDAPQDRNRPV
jgi:zinc transporter